MYFVDRHLRDYALAHPDLVSVRMSIRYPNLQVVKYKNKVFYKNLWTPELTKFRGLVVDRDWNIVVRPFDKVFNRFENGTDMPLDTEVFAVRKVNGFMACLTVDEEYGTIVSTTGSLDSPFVQMAEKYLLPIVPTGLLKGVTYVFEIVDPEDPHIIQEEPGAYLIGVIAICSQLQPYECDLDRMAKGMGVKRPEWKRCAFGEVVEEVKTVKHEGFMVYDDFRKNVLKIKSPYYLTKKFFSRVSGEKLTENWLAANRDGFDEEYYPLIDYIKAHRDAFTELDQEGRKIFIEDFLCRL